MNARPTPAKFAQLLESAQLAALPQSAIRLLELSQDPNNGPNEFAVPIESDPGLAGQVLKFVNSSYFGFSREIASVRLAITLVGIRTIKNFALWSAVFNLMPNPKCGPFDLKSLWQDSLRRALFARSFGKVLGLRDTEDLFAASLLQDMAVPLLAKEFGARYAKLLEGRSRGQRLSDLEQAEFGWTHAEVGAAMARAWRLPDAFADLIESHTAIDRCLAGESAPAGQIAVAVAAELPSAADQGWSGRERFQRAVQQFAKKDGASLVSLLGKVDEEFDDFAPVLKVAKPPRTLVQMYSTEDNLAPV